MTDVSPELAFVMACGRTRIDAVAWQRIREAAADVKDWWHVVHVAEFHRVVPMVDHALRATAPPQAPAVVVEHVARRSRGMSERARRLEQAAARLTTAFAVAGVPLLFFKGPSVAHDGYADPTLRDYTDLDVLIRGGDRPRVAACLHDLGYAGEALPKSWGASSHDAMYNADVYRHPGENVELDVHWHVLPPLWTFPLDLSGFWERSRFLDIGADAPIPALGPEDELLLITLHGTKERWNRLRMACDVAEFLAAHKGLDVERLFARARTQGCGTMFLLGLSLARRWVGADLPETANRLIAASPSLKALEQRATHTIASGDERGSLLWDFSRLRFFALDRTVDRLDHLARFVLMPRSRHLTMVRLPLRWYWAYVPVRILHDFIILPAWLVCRSVAMGQRAEGGARRPVE